MIEIKYTLSLDDLLGQFIKDINSKWNDPFKSPIVIFSNSRLEQWFKYNWLNNKDNGVLMNLEYARLESFMFDVLRSNNPCRQLDSSILRDILIAHLSDINNIKSLNDNSVEKYLLDQNGVNEIRLYDFASQMANLFIQYEIDDEISNITGWQKTLYNTLLSKNGVVLNVSKTVNGNTTVDAVTYSTHYQVLNVNGGQITVPEQYKGRPILLFGFSGMGKLYRETFKKVGSTNDVTLYLQTEGNTFPTFPNNAYATDLSVNGQYGMDLWKGVDKHKCESNSKENGTLYSQLHRWFDNSSSTNVSGISVSSCPSKLREMEIVHSKICKLLTQKENKLSDILVVAPQIQEYKTVISQLFDVQPKMPYVIADYATTSSFAADAIAVLNRMMYKGKLTRSDFFELLRNPFIQETQGISEEDVNIWVGWAEKMNVFRDRPNKNDWQDAKIRLLTARLTSSDYDNNGEIVTPFGNMETQNDVLLNHFISLVDKCLEWCALSSNPDVDSSTLEKIDETLSHLLHKKGELPDFLATEELVYIKIKSEINQKKFLLNSNLYNGKMSLKCLILSILSVANGTDVNIGNVFLDGLTFASIKSNRVMSAKYVFMIGMDSKIFPGQDIHNELDLSTRDPKDSMPAQNKNTFLCHISAVEKELHISYVNRDLEKDAPFYMASPVLDLINGLGVKEVVYGIDETRPVAELFSQHEISNKEIYNQTNGAIATQLASITATTSTTQSPNNVKVYDFVSFLEDPFEFQVKKLYSEIDKSNPEKIEFEPLCLEVDSLVSSMYRKEYVKRKLNNESDSTIKQDFISRLKCDNSYSIPEHIQYYVDGIASEGYLILQNISNLKLKTLNFDGVANLKLSYNSNPFDLSGSLAWYVWQNNELNVVTISSNLSLINAYVSSLIIIAQEKKEGDFVANLYSFNKKGELDNKTYKISPSKAVEILVEIYEKAFVSRFSKCIFAEDVVNGTNYTSFWDFMQLFSGRMSRFEYFTQKELFESISTVLGYSENSFQTEYDNANKKMKKLIVFLIKR